MAKLYSKKPLQKVNYLKPRKETVGFILNYSKALKITNNDGMKFDAFLN